MPEMISLSHNFPNFNKSGVKKKGSEAAHAQNAKPSNLPLFSGTVKKNTLNQDKVEFSSKKRRLEDSEESSQESATEDDNDDAMTFDLAQLIGGKPFFMLQEGPPPSGPPKKPGEKSVNFAENIKPLHEEHPDLESYKEAGSPFADRLAEISSRAYLNNAVLKSDNEPMKKGILMKLKEKLAETPLFSVDLHPQNTKGLKRDESGSVVSHALSQPAEQLGLPASKPAVLVINNAGPADVHSLQQQETYQRIKNKNPHFRFILNNAGTPKPDSSAEGGMRAALQSIFGGGEDSQKSGAAVPYEEVEVPPITLKQWSTILPKDKQAKQIMDHWKLDVSPDTFKEFLEVLQREKQAPLEREEVLADLDSLGSFMRVRKHDKSKDITRSHINQFAREVLSTRRKQEKVDGALNDKMPKPYTIIHASDIKTRLDDVVGHDRAKQVLSQALEAVKYPSLYEHLDEGDEDAQNNNVLLLGEPGGGKTMLAKAIAGQGKGTFISSSGSQFVNMFVGMGANNVRRLKAAVEEAPDDLAVVFVDEIDSLGSRDGMNGAGSKDLNGLGANREEAQTINEFLAFTEGVGNSNKKMLLIGATNRPDSLDPAILSRFHHKIEIQKLDTDQRKALLQNQMKQKKLGADKSVNLEQVAKETKDFSGRDLRNLMKLAKQELILQIPKEEKERLEHDAKARQNFQLKLTQDVLTKAMNEVKEGWKKAGKKGKEESPPPFGMYN